MQVVKRDNKIKVSMTEIVIISQVPMLENRFTRDGLTFPLKNLSRIWANRGRLSIKMIEEEDRKQRSKFDCRSGT